LSTDMLDIVGWDIGGVNIKASRVLWRAGAVVESRTAVRPFEIWRALENLPSVLGRIGEELDIRATTAMALTMTAELADAFRTKREGVLAILDAMSRVFPDVPIHPLSLDGCFVPIAEARERPLDFAANNWLASGLYLARRHPFCLLMDVGSTTTDIIPIREGRVVCTGRTDMERLTSGELIYSGILRTNPNTIAGQVPVNGRMCRTAAELFTLMADVHLLSGNISPEDYTCPTADGRTKSSGDARERLTRLVCADGEMLNEEQTLKLAKYLFEKQVQQLTEALCQVLSRLEDGYDLPLVAAGAGAFLVHQVGLRLGLRVLDLLEEGGVEAATAFPARAAACLLAMEFEEGICSKP
jgi:(4-(4-[2-(gamma-L-glutamylamino)ethyl]phenoxymethyl)furan-2-yl)methanamine synthase